MQDIHISHQGHVIKSILFLNLSTKKIIPIKWENRLMIHHTAQVSFYNTLSVISPLYLQLNLKVPKSKSALNN